MNNESKTQPLNLSDSAIENAEQTALIITRADELNIPRDEISGLMLDAIDTDDADPFMQFIRDLLPSDYDHDTAMHDVDHAVQSYEVCDVHPTICSVCCDAH